jgi:hypothetical protein
MSIKTRLAQVGRFVLLAGLFGCSTLADLGIAVPYLGDPPVTAIAHLAGKPKGALVYLRGVVEDQAPFLTGGAYRLQDESGTIWIRSNHSRLPQKGREIVVKGKIDLQNVPRGVQEESEVYVQELEQMEAVAVNASPTPTPALKPSPQPSPVAAEIVPPQPPAATRPIADPLDTFFLPHKQGPK